MVRGLFALILPLTRAVGAAYGAESTPLGKPTKGFGSRFLLDQTNRHGI